MGQVRRPADAAGATAGISRPTCRSRATGRRRHCRRRTIAVPETLAGRPCSRRCRRRPASARILNEIGRGDDEFAGRIVTTSPDVTVSTNLGPWVNRRGLFAREAMADTFKSERIPSTFNWEFSPKGQHIELGIAEMNLFILLVGARPVALASTASGCCRSARSTTRSSRAASMRSTTPATRTPASSWWRRRPASRWRRKAARTSRSPSR